MKSIFVVGLATLVFAATLSLCPAAQASAKRPTRLTVQQWILVRGVSQAVRSGSTWIDLRAALQSANRSDSVFRDYRGAAPGRTAVYFALVRDALQAGHPVTASRLLGILAHYYADACDPLHIGDSARAKSGTHRRFELSVRVRLHKHGRFERRILTALAASAASAGTGAAHAAQIASVGRDVAGFTASSATRAHLDSGSLARNYRRHGFNRVAARIASSTLLRSARGLASLIEAATQPAAAISPLSPDSAAPLSMGSAASASSQDILFHAARLADDGDGRSAWLATVRTYPQWWQVNLGASRELDSIAIDWLSGSSRSYRYDIQVSDDGTTWHEVIDQSSRAAFGSSNDSLRRVSAHYLRVDVLGYDVGRKAVNDAASAGFAGILECRVYGPAAPTPDPTATPSPTPTVSPTATPTVSPDPTPTITPTPTPTVTPTPIQGTVIAVPSHATKAQIDACVGRAVAAGSGAWIEFPAGVFAYAGTFIVPDGINVRGQGIWDQGLAAGGGGTWLQSSTGLNWGSDSTIEDLLVGKNTAGVTCTFHPVARGSSLAGADTQVHGSHDVAFNSVRFKGGSDKGDDLIGTGGNYTSSWNSVLKRYDFVDTTFNDCEFERPQITNAAAGTRLGTILNLWWDVRPGGAQVHDLTFRRCHFGVKNGYHSGLDGYGSGRTILLQAAPSSSDSTGPTIGGGSVINSTNWNPKFNWGQVDHGAYNIVFVDDVFEYSFWYPMDICDYSRPYSTWHGVQAGAADGGASIGWGNPPGSHWTAIPTPVWNDNISITRSYFKGSYPVAHSVVFEIARNTHVLDSYTGTGSFGNHAGTYGNTVSGSYSAAKRPHTAVLTTDWSGTQTTYTPSPNDP